LDGEQPVARPLPAHRTTQTQNKSTQTSMPRVGFELTIPVFEWAKTVHALDRADTVITYYIRTQGLLNENFRKPRLILNTHITVSITSRVPF
jgi:hypothetical protein